MRANNNPKNKRGLLDYQKRQLELSRITEDDARKRRIDSNLERWIALTPREYKNAKPSNLHPDTIQKIKNTSIKPPYDKFIIVTAEDVTTATFAAYATIYALVKGGVITPSEIKVTSIMDGYSNIHGMFSSRNWKDNFFDSSSQLLLINGVSKPLTKLGSKGEEQFWRELIEHSRDNSKLVIITYATEEEEKEKDVFIPLMTSNKELNASIIRKSMFIKLTNTEEEEIKNEQRKSY